MRNKFISNVLTIIGLLILLIVFIEVGLRVVVHFRYGKPGKTYGIYMADKEFGAVHRPHSYNNNSVINNWGFRNTEDIDIRKPAGAIRIYCSGGSTTFCYNLPTEKAWPSILQQKLRILPGHERDEVLNAAEITIAVANEFALARRFIPRLKPDIVILYGTGINEQECARNLQYADKADLDKLLAEKRWGVFSRKLDQVRFLKRNSVTVKAFEYYILTRFKYMISQILKAKQVSTQRGYPHPWTVENFRQTLSAYIDFLRSNGCKVIIVLHGDNGDDSAPYLKDYILSFRDIALEVGREKQVTIFDFSSTIESLPNRRGLFYSWVHLNKEGAELLASELVPVVLSVSKETK